MQCLLLFLPTQLSSGKCQINIMPKCWISLFGVWFLVSPNHPCKSFIAVWLWGYWSQRTDCVQKTLKKADSCWNRLMARPQAWSYMFLMSLGLYVLKRCVCATRFAQYTVYCAVCFAQNILSCNLCLAQHAYTCAISMRNIHAQYPCAISMRNIHAQYGLTMWMRNIFRAGAGSKPAPGLEPAPALTGAGSTNLVFSKTNRWFSIIFVFLVPRVCKSTILSKQATKKSGCPASATHNFMKNQQMSRRCKWKKSNSN